jgi:hypothetical protein
VFRLNLGHGFVFEWILLVFSLFVISPLGSIEMALKLLSKLSHSVHNSNDHYGGSDVPSRD